MFKSSIIRAPCNHVNLTVGLDRVYIGKEFVLNVERDCSTQKAESIVLADISFLQRVSQVNFTLFFYRQTMRRESQLFTIA